MPISNYPNGFAQGVAIRGMPLLNLHGGEVFWVDSNNGADTGKGTHNQPFETLDYTIGRCTANRGAKIVIKAKHAETYASAAALAIDIAGIEVICLGEGADRPTFTFSAEDATMVISAASFTMRNFIVKPSIDSVVSPIVIQAADCTLDFELQDESAEVECLRAILTTADADRLDINLKYRGFIGGGACDNAIRLVGVDSARINVDFYGIADVAIVEFHTTACHDIDVKGLFYNESVALTKNVVDSVGGTPSTWSVTGYDSKGDAAFSGGDNKEVAYADVETIASDLVVLDALIDTIKSDLIVSQSDVKAVISGLTIVESDIKVLDPLIDTVKSDLIVTQSDVKVALSGLTIIESDLKVLDPIIDAIKSDLIVTQSDVKVALSGLLIVESDVKVSLSGLTIIESDIKVLDPIIDTIKSDLIVSQSDVKVVLSGLTIVESDVKVALSGLTIIESDLKFFWGAWQTFETIMSDFVVKYASDVP